MANGAVDEWQDVQAPPNSGEWEDVTPQKPGEGLPTASGFLQNAITSGGRMVAGAANAVMHPLDTATNLAKLGIGIVASANQKSREEHPEEAAMADAFAQQFRDKYGSLDAIKHTLYTDPASVAADLSTFLSGAGAAAKGVEAATGAAKAGEVARALETAGELTNPLSVARLPGIAAKPFAGKLYTSALKPSTTESVEDAEKLVNTGMSEGIPVSEAGVRKLYGLVADLGDKVKQQIRAGAARGITVDPHSVAARANQVVPTFKNQVNPETDLAAIQNAKDEFLRQHQVITPASPILNAQGQPIRPALTTTVPIPADEAQAIKQGTYRQLSKKYGELSSATVESQKALARGLKEELDSAFPEIAAQNGREAKLLQLAPALERAVRRIDNHDLMGIGTPIVAAAGGAIAGHAGAGIAAGILKSVLDNPELKSRLAIAIQRGSKYTGKATTYTNALSRVNEYINSLTSGTPPALEPAGTAQ